jgi:hypothetical protein
MMIKYRFPADGQSTGSLDEYIRVGFSTQMKQGILMQIINPEIEEHMTVYINSNGGVTVEFNFGWGRYEGNNCLFYIMIFRRIVSMLFDGYFRLQELKISTKFLVRGFTFCENQ